MVVGAFFALFFSIICGRAIHLQIFCYSYLSNQAAEQYKKSLHSKGKRGTIYDRNMKEVAVSIDVTSIAAYPPHIRDISATARQLAEPLDLSEAVLIRKLSANSQFVWLKRHVTPRESKVVRSLKLGGISFMPEQNRYYPNRKLAAQVLGFTGVDNQGLEGLEFRYDLELKGDAGKSLIVRDALGRGIAGGSGIEEIPDYGGKNLVLTIDRTIQYITEKSLKDGVYIASAKSGIAIVAEPETGAILALAHFPFFNPNAFEKFGSNTWRNRAVTDAFEPGSTMKIFSAAAALESGVCTPSTIFYCENGAYDVGEETVHDTSKHGWLTLHKIIKFSSNIGAVKVGEMVGPKVLYETLRGFGFGQKTGVECPGETSGSLAPFERWSKIDTGTISFGHGISVSVVQLITAVSAIANGGALMKPRIVTAITDSNGKVVETFEPALVRQAISPKTAKTVKRMMRAVVEKGGTGELAALKGYGACGKTGTAQKLDASGSYSDGKHVSSFIGFAPYDNPKIAVLVVLDEPATDYYGGKVCAPVFSKIAQETLNYLNIPPEPPVREERLTVSLENEVSG